MRGKQYTIRGIPEKLDSALREEAATSGKSLNTLLIDKLSESCRLIDESWTNGIEKFAASMEHDPEFEAALAGCREIHPGDWPELDLKPSENGPAHS